jgi:hypothetical protein
MTEPVNVFEPDMIEAVAEYMARYEKGSGRSNSQWANEDMQRIWRSRAKNAIGIAAEFVLAQSGHWDAPRKDGFKDLHEHMAKSMFYEETRTEEFPNDEKRDLWRNRAHWAMIAIGQAMPLYAGAA